MEVFLSIADTFSPILKNLWVQIALLIAFATFHGYAGAWLAVRMLFRPRRPFKVLGITLFPQGMIPRHRDRLANAIGKAVGDELVSQETIMDELLGKEFLKKKISSVVDSYTDSLLAASYPSLVEALPAKLRSPVLEGIASLQLRVAEHISSVLKSETSVETIRGFVERRVDDVLSRRVSSVVSDEAFEKIVTFLEKRAADAVNSPVLESKIREFVDRRIDDLAHTETTVGSLVTDDAVALVKEKAGEQIAPIAHQLTEIAAAQRTRDQIGALIKREVHDYYEALPFFKKIFVSRENLLGEVDSLVNESLPKRIEETLKGDLFAEEARGFIYSSIDNLLSRPIEDVIGKIAPKQLERVKEQIVRGVLSVVRGTEMQRAISGYLRDTLAGFRPHSIDSIMRTLNPESEAKLKEMLAKGLLRIISGEETAKAINSMLAHQVDRLLATPIGRLSDNIAEDKLRDAGQAVSDAVITAIREKLPDAIREFNVGGVVREKIMHYPVEKLEALVLSVAKEHLRTIEAFGALFGFFIGVVQAVQCYIYAQ